MSWNKKGCDALPGAIVVWLRTLAPRPPGHCGSLGDVLRDDALAECARSLNDMNNGCPTVHPTRAHWRCTAPVARLETDATTRFCLHCIALLTTQRQQLRCPVGICIQNEQGTARLRAVVARVRARPPRLPHTSHAHELHKCSVLLQPAQRDTLTC